jgi:hypothetical protein
LFVPVLVASGLSVANVPSWSYPVAYALLASALAVSPYAMPPRLRDILFGPFLATGHVVAIGAGLLALLVVGIGPDERWYLPATAVALASFYWLQCALALRATEEWPAGSLGFDRIAAGRGLQDAAFLASGAAVVSLAYAIELGPAWYGLAALAVAGVYVAALCPFGLRWAAHQELGSFAALALAIAVAVPFFAAGAVATAVAGFTACVLYMLLAWLWQSDVGVFPYLPRLGSAESGCNAIVRAAAGGLPVYAAAVALCAGFSELLEATSVVDVTNTTAVAWAFFGLSIGLFLIAAGLRWYWPGIRVHVYAAAVAIAAGVATAVIGEPGPFAGMLATLAVAGFAASVWERVPLVLFPAATAAFCAFLAGWRFLTPDDAYAPLLLALCGAGLLLMAAHQSHRLGRNAAVVAGIGLTTSWRRPRWAGCASLC